jgi:hypothetical protein
VFICLTPIAMRKLHIICDTFASKYDIVFDADKSKFFIVVPTRWRNQCDSFNQCVFYIGCKSIEKAITYPHPGHIVSANLDDTVDVMHRRSHFIGQENNLLCFFSKRDVLLK